jgi:hypothetical protein
MRKMLVSPGDLRECLSFRVLRGSISVVVSSSATFNRPKYTIVLRKVLLKPRAAKHLYSS